MEKLDWLNAALEDDEMPIVLNENFMRFPQDSYLHGYDANMNIWNPMIEDASLYC